MEDNTNVDDYIRVIPIDRESEAFKQFHQRIGTAEPWVDATGRVYLRVLPGAYGPDKQDRLSAPENWFYLCDIEGNPLTPQGEPVK